MRFVAFLLVLASMVSCLIGCSQQTKTAEPQAKVPYAIPYQEMDKIGYRAGWSTDSAVNPGNQVTKAAVLGDYVSIVETPSNVLSTFDRKNGQLLWKGQAGRPGERIHGPYMYENLILVNTDWQIWGYDAKTGELVTMSDLKSVVRAAPAMQERIAVFGGTDGTAFAIDVTTGQIIWRYDLTSAFHAKPLAAINGAFVADSSGVYAMLDFLTGELLWRGRVFGAITANPSADAQRIYLPSMDRSMYALDRTSGRDRWSPFRSNIPLSKPALVELREVFLPLPGYGLTALRAATGEEIWRKPLLVDPIAVVGPNLFARDPDEIFVINPSDGEVKAQAMVPLLAELLVTENDRLIAVTKDGILTQMVPKR